MPGPARARDDGAVTAAFTACVALTLVLLVMAAEQLVVHYARGVLQSAVEEGARQAAATGDPATCAARVDDAIADGLGTLADQVAAGRCARSAEGWAAEVDAAFAPWLPIRDPSIVTAHASVAVAAP